MLGMRVREGGPGNARKVASNGLMALPGVSAAISPRESTTGRRRALASIRSTPANWYNSWNLPVARIRRDLYSDGAVRRNYRGGRPRGAYCRPVHFQGQNEVTVDREEVARWPAAQYRTDRGLSRLREHQAGRRNEEGADRGRKRVSCQSSDTHEWR